MAEVSEMLEIVTLANRVPFKINGAVYEMLDASEMTLADQLRLASIGDQYANFETYEPGSDEQSELVSQIGETLDWAVRTITRGIPDDVFNALTDTHKTMIVEAFVKTFEAGRSVDGNTSDQS